MGKAINRIGIDYVGISVVFLCHDGKGSILLHKRSNQCRDERGKWDCGGGQLEFGENLETGVLREVREEYCCDGAINEQLPAYSIVRTVKKTKTHWIAIPFIIKVNPKQVAIGDPEKIERIHWFQWNHLPKPLHSGFQRELILFQNHMTPFTNS